MAVIVFITAQPAKPKKGQPKEFAQRSLAAASATLRQPPGCTLPLDQQTNNPNTQNHDTLS